MPSRFERTREVALAASVGIVLADSSIVTLGLPDVLQEFDGTVVGVSWVLTAFNLMLALAILPAVHLGRRDPYRGWAAGLGGFAIASLACALAPSLIALIGARVLQALFGAVIVACAIEVIARGRGSHERGAAVWGAAGTIGVAIGPAAGGVLTELLSWQSIFFVQVPLLLAVPMALRGGGGVPEPGPEGEPDLRPEVALALLSAGLTAALFLLVILLTEGWALSPLAAAATVSAIPIAAFAARWLIRHAGPPVSAALAGALAIAGGLAALGVLPGASWALTLQPQVLIGIGLALALPVLTLAAVGGRDPDGSRAGSTIAARHIGIVIGIVALAPLLSSQLETQRDRAQEASTALLLDANLPPDTKVAIGEAVAGQINLADGRLPQIAPAFDEVTPPAGTEEDFKALESGIEDQVQRAATHAFSLPFLGAAIFALLSLIPIARLGTTPSERRTRVEEPI
jgi:predicted MFS family arabinose efflux permease